MFKFKFLFLTFSLFLSIISEAEDRPVKPDQNQQKTEQNPANITVSKPAARYQARDTFDTASLWLATYKPYKDFNYDYALLKGISSAAYKIVISANATKTGLDKPNVDVLLISSGNAGYDFFKNTPPPPAGIVGSVSDIKGSVTLDSFDYTSSSCETNGATVHSMTVVVKVIRTAENQFHKNTNTKTHVIQISARTE